MSDVMESTGALALIETTNLVAIFTDEGGVEAIVKRIEADARARAADLDISTARGREEIASLARTKIARSKTALISAGKKLTEDWRKQTAAVNADCKLIETRLDALRDEVRAPLTAWENAEKDRIKAHEAALAAITEGPGYGTVESAAEIQMRLDYLNAYPARDWQEFAKRANDALAAEIERTAGLLRAAEKREAEAAELARLRAEEAERQRQAEEKAKREREERIAAEAAEKARIEAEAKAERERQEAAAKAEAERQAAACREREATEAKERAEAAAQKAEQDRIAAEQRAEHERIAAAERAEQARLEAEARAKRQAEEAAAAERRRIEAEAEKKRQEDERRAANVAHRKRINNEVLAALVEHAKLPDDAAKAVIEAIVRSLIPHVSIQY